jgi:hypothetical protein
MDAIKHRNRLATPNLKKLPENGDSVDQVLEVVNRRAPPITLRAKKGGAPRHDQRPTELAAYEMRLTSAWRAAPT